MATRPLVLPEAYSGETSWEDWAFHFENVAAVNEWTAEQKMQWLKVRLTGRAQRAFQHLSEISRGSYAEAVKALRERFEPKSRQSRYEAEFQTRRKRKSEGWADFAEDLKLLADKAFPDLQEAARTQLAINSYLQQLSHPQVAFGVKQKRPKTIDEVVSATLEMESYITQPTSHSGTAAAASIATETESPATVAANMTERLTTLVERLTEKVEQLELKYVQGSGTGEKNEVFPYRGRSRGRGRGGSSGGSSGGRGGTGGGGWNSQGGQRSFDMVCWNCGLTGHIARNCQSVGHGQADEGGKNMACNPSIIATSHNSPTGGYRIEAIVNGIDTSLLLDTGAAVSLIREDIWLRGKDNKSGELQPWTQHNLVSVDGSPLHIHGYTIATVELGGAELQVGMVVVSPLTTEAILGLDFLSKHRANIDLRKEEVHLDSCPKVLKLTNKTTTRVKEDTTDALSQLPCQQCGRTSYQQSTEAADSAPPENIEQLQQDDPHIGPILKAKIDDKKPAPQIIQAASGSTKRLFQIWEQLFVKRNCLYRLYQHPNTKTEYRQLIIPLAKREEILCDMHEALGRHLGEEKTFCRLRERYYWPGYYSDVQHWC